MHAVVQARKRAKERRLLQEDSSKTSSKSSSESIFEAVTDFSQIEEEDFYKILVLLYGRDTHTRDKISSRRFRFKGLRELSILVGDLPKRQLRSNDEFTSFYESFGRQIIVEGKRRYGDSDGLEGFEARAQNARGAYVI